jgi:hypothetical protein
MREFAKGTIEIQDGYYEQKIQYDPSFRQGLVRKDYNDQTFVPKPSFKIDNNKKTLVMNISCFTYASVYNEGTISTTNNIIRKDSNYKKVTGKNIFKNIKDFVCSAAGSQEASLVRKRLIGLQKIHKTISNEAYPFRIQNL